MDNEIVKFSRVGTTLIARICCEIDHHTASRLRARIDRAIFLERPKILCLHFGEVRFMDSSGIGLVIGRAEICRELGITVRLTGLSSTAKRLITLSGVDKLQNLTVEI